MPSNIWRFPFGFIGIFLVFFGIPILLFFSILMGIITMVAGVFLAIIYFAFRPKYRTNCFVWLDRPGETARYIFDKGGRFTNDDGTFYYQFKGLKDTTQAISFELLYPTKKGEVASFFSPAPGQYFPMRLNKETKKMEVLENIPDPNYIPKMIPHPKKPGTFIPDSNFPMQFVQRKVEKDIPDWHWDVVPENQREYLVLKLKRNKQKYQTTSNWDRWYPIIALAIIMILVVVVISSLFSSLNPFMEKLTQATGATAAALDRNARVNELMLQYLENRTASTPGGPPTPPDVQV